MARLDPEVLEQRFTIVVEEFSVREGSDGTGRHRGGNGVVRRLRFLEPMTATILSVHRRMSPAGMNGARIASRAAIPFSGRMARSKNSPERSAGMSRP